ncbi:MAG TPA: OsmC family protein [Gemmatimonadaceae bacterium]|jgi:putative redox protein
MSSAADSNATPASDAELPAPTGPVISKTEVAWRGDRLFDAGPTGRTHRIDAAAKVAPGPVETLLSAIASCSGVDVIDIIAKRKTPVERMTVNVTAERRSEFPRRVQKLQIDFHIDGTGIEKEHAERAIQLSFERYCSVAASLAPDIVTDTTLTLNGETFPAVRQKVWRPS